MTGWNGYGHMGWMPPWWFVGAALVGLLFWALLRTKRMSGGRE